MVKFSLYLNRRVFVMSRVRGQVIQRKNSETLHESKDTQTIMKITEMAKVSEPH